jgi:hypothetical protein
MMRSLGVLGILAGTTVLGAAACSSGSGGTADGTPDASSPSSSSSGGSGSSSGSSSGGSGSGSSGGASNDGGATGLSDGETWADGGPLCYCASMGGCAIAGADDGVMGAAAAALCTEAMCTPVNTCPTANLVGCCKYSGAVARAVGPESCSYTNSGMATSDLMQSCALDYGTWTTTP